MAKPVEARGARPIRPGESQHETELVREARRIEDTVQVDLPDRRVHKIAVDVPAMTVVKVLAVLFAAYIFVQVWPLITLLLISVMLAAALSPYLALLERHGLSRGWGITVIALSLIVGLGGLLALVIPSLVAQTRDLIGHSDQYARNLQALLAQHGIHVNLVKEWHSIPKKLSGLSSKLVDVFYTIFNGAVALFTTLFVTVYLLFDQERIKDFFVGMFPQKRRADALRVLAELRKQVGGYVRGQLITSGLAGLFAFIVLEAAQIPNPIALAAFVAVTDLIPLFGQTLGTIPAVLIALTISPLHAVGVLVGFILYQNVENHYIVPRVYSNTMNVSSLVALVALLIGAKLLGFLGMLVALPLVAALPVILDFVGVHLRMDRVRPPATSDASQDIKRH
jgi:predicted PurR-regulated permease PerM